MPVLLATRVPPVATQNAEEGEHEHASEAPLQEANYEDEKVLVDNVVAQKSRL